MAIDLDLSDPQVLLQLLTTAAKGTSGLASLLPNVIPAQIAAAAGPIGAIAGPAAAFASGNPASMLNTAYSLPSTIATLAPYAADAAASAGLTGLGSLLGELGASAAGMATPIGIAALPVALTRAVSGIVDSRAKAKNKERYAKQAAEDFRTYWPTLSETPKLWEDIQGGQGDAQDWLTRSDAALKALPGIQRAEQNEEFRKYGLKEKGDALTGALPHLGSQAYLARLKALDAGHAAGLEGGDAPAFEDVLKHLTQWGGVDNYSPDLERTANFQPAPLAYDVMNPTADLTPWEEKTFTSYADLPAELRDAYQPGKYYDTAVQALGYFNAGDPTGSLDGTAVGSALGEPGLAGLMAQPFGAPTPKPIRPWHPYPVYDAP